MKKFISGFLGLSITFLTGLKSQQSNDTLVFLLTCVPGTATYSIYGHSALRVVIPLKGYDMVYNWGVFDFSTPNFAWKFAKGRLNYMLGVYPYELFIREYFIDRRSVYSQRVIIDGEDLKQLFILLEENLKPENLYYRYDFFYDNCSTRIRDLFERIFGDRLIYPPDDLLPIPTFRDKISEYQIKYPWLKLGVDLGLGLPADKKANFRDRMFLPEELMQNLAKTTVRRYGKIMPLLRQTQTIFEFDPHIIKTPFYSAPMFVLSVLFVIILFMSIRYRHLAVINYADILIFALFGAISLILVFFNFITDHTQTRMNLNLVWINPFVIICLFCIVFNKPGVIWFRSVFWLAVLFLAAAFVFTSKINSAFIPVALILALRSSARADFSWCPYRISESYL